MVRDCIPGQATGMHLDIQSSAAPDEAFSCWKVILVSSSRHPDQWIVPGGGMEPEEEPCGAAVREVFEEVRPSFHLKKIKIYTSRAKFL